MIVSVVISVSVLSLVIGVALWMLIKSSTKLKAAENSLKTTELKIAALNDSLKKEKEHSLEQNEHLSQALSTGDELPSITPFPKKEQPRIAVEEQITFLWFVKTLFYTLARKESAEIKRTRKNITLLNAENDALNIELDEEALERQIAVERYYGSSSPTSS